MKIKFAKKEDRSGFKPLLVIMKHRTITVAPWVISSIPAVVMVVFLMLGGEK